MNSRSIPAALLETALGLLLTLYCLPLLAAENVQPASSAHPALILTPAEVEAAGLADSTESRLEDFPSSPTEALRPRPPAGSGGPVRVSILDTTIKLGLILLLLYVSLLLYRNIAHRRHSVNDRGDTTLCILQTVPLHGSKSIHLVEAGPRTFLIAESGSRLAILADLTPSGRSTDESRAARAVQRAHARTRARASYAGAEQVDVIEDDAVGSALEWEEESRGPDACVTRTRRRATHPVAEADSGDNDETRTIRSRRALLLRALRSREEARREPAFTQREPL